MRSPRAAGACLLIATCGHATDLPALRQVRATPTASCARWPLLRGQPSTTEVELAVQASAPCDARDTHLAASAFDDCRYAPAIQHRAMIARPASLIVAQRHSRIDNLLARTVARDLSSDRHG